MHTAKLYAQGGSIALTIPRALLNSIGLSSGAQVNIEADGKNLVISPVRPKYTLNELLAGMEEGDMPFDKEWDRMPAVGRELI
jgi:antitoxin component of MazEF toxin-antitoxin module